MTPDLSGGLPSSLVSTDTVTAPLLLVLLTPQAYVVATDQFYLSMPALPLPQESMGLLIPPAIPGPSTYSESRLWLMPSISLVPVMKQMSSSMQLTVDLVPVHSPRPRGTVCILHLGAGDLIT